ncbi:MAG: DUF2309 domain-containing protein [Methylocystis sp.]
MNTAVPLTSALKQAVLATTPSREDIERAIEAACKRVAPLWPLKNFVAVNPFLGFSHQSFEATGTYLKRVADADMLAPRSFYRAAISSGLIDDRSLEQALASTTTRVNLPVDVEALKRAAQAEPKSSPRPSGAFTTVAELLDALADGDRQASLVGFMIDEISKWCAAYFDEGQASWRLPQRSLGPYAAWRASARFDRNPEAMGVKGFRRNVLALPENPIDAVLEVIERLEIPMRAVDDYLYRALFDVGGWAAYARHLVWNSELYGERNNILKELLAIRVAYGYGLFQARNDATFRAAWAYAMAEAAKPPIDHRLNDDPELALDRVLHEAYEIAFRRRFIARLLASALRPSRSEARHRSPVQAAFCIDVRSEIFRRALETVSPEFETLGFAGFFGLPIEYVPIGQSRGGGHCPVLLKPHFVVCEAVRDASEEEELEVLGLRLLRRRAAKAWKAFKLSAVSSFAYVETLGFTYLLKILSDSLNLTRTVPDPNLDGFDRAVLGRLGPRIEAGALDGRMTGFNHEQSVAMAEAVLRSMSLTKDFGRLLLLVGHGSTTVNNPHASGLDCGACGGHTGEANARVAAAILNDPRVRRGLRVRGIVVPEDSFFLGALHDTTTDEVKIFDADRAPESHLVEITELETLLGEAGALARSERAVLLGAATDRNIDKAVCARSRDWSQVRPEWGLAGNAAFIAAPRERTSGVDLGGRAFLHSYDHRSDEGFRILELIMTAPMVVASWINLQYFGSTTNNKVFGSGNKTLHNVVGQLGVLEGNAGDLRVGLAWQSVHDGRRFVHEPLRLNVFIEAPEAAMDTIIQKNAHVHELVENGWLFLHAIADGGARIRRRLAAGEWRDCTPETGQSASRAG